MRRGTRPPLLPGQVIVYAILLSSFVGGFARAVLLELPNLLNTAVLLNLLNSVQAGSGVTEPLRGHEHAARMHSLRYTGAEKPHSFRLKEVTPAVLVVAANVLNGVEFLHKAIVPS
jgi:hypothetical protein